MKQAPPAYADDTAKEMLLEFSVVEIGGTTLALKSAENFRALRRRGVTIPSCAGHPEGTK